MLSSILFVEFGILGNWYHPQRFHSERKPVGVFYCSSPRPHGTGQRICANAHGSQIRPVFLDTKVSEHTCHPNPMPIPHTHVHVRACAHTPI